MVPCADYLFYCPICTVFSFRYIYIFKLNTFGYFREVWLALFVSSSHRLQFGINGSCFHLLMINLLHIHIYFNWLFFPWCKVIDNKTGKCIQFMALHLCCPSFKSTTVLFLCFVLTEYKLILHNRSRNLFKSAYCCLKNISRFSGFHPQTMLLKPPSM